MVEKCSVADCQNPAHIAPCINVPATGWSVEMHTPIKSLMDLPICKDHKDTVKIEDFLQENLKEVIRILARGKCPPDFDRAWISFVKTDSKEFQDIRQAKADAKKD